MAPWISTPSNPAGFYFLTNDLNFGTSSNAQAVCADGTAWSSRSLSLAGVASVRVSSQPSPMASDVANWSERVDDLQAIARRAGLRPEAP